MAFLSSWTFRFLVPIDTKKSSLSRTLKKCRKNERKKITQICREKERERYRDREREKKRRETDRERERQRET